MKAIKWLGSSYRDLTQLPKRAQKAIGYQLHNVQSGLEPDDWKPMPSIGLGVKEIRIHFENEYRVIYIVKFNESIYVLHVFVKKTQKTLKRDIDIVRQRLQRLGKAGEK